MPDNVQHQDPWYVANFDVLERSLNGESALPVHGLRKRAFARLSEIGFPTTRQEEWRFTNIAPIAKTAFTPVLRYDPAGVTRDAVSRFALGGAAGGPMIVFVNGHFSPELSRIGRLPAGVTVTSLASALRIDGADVYTHLGRYASFTEHPFAALNTAFVQDGAYIHCADGTTPEEPVHILYVGAGSGSPFVAQARNLIVLGKDCKLSVVESYASLTDAAYLTNAVTEIAVGTGSVVEHDRIQTENLQAYHVGSTAIHQERSSSVTSNSVVLGGALVRNDIVVRFNDEACECTLNGLSVATEKQLVDSHTVIDHAMPRCVSHELYKAVLDGAARGVFNGKIFVRPDAQQTDARQTNKTLLLSDEAVINTKPQLEIFADDVKCTHGATVGQLDEEQVFYLRSRGIGEEAARDLLTLAFAGDVISRIHIVPLREKLDAMLRARLNQGRITRDL